MQIIDKNSENLPEGDYLQLCNLLRNVYVCKERKEMNTLFDYGTFDIFVPDQSREILEYFYSHYYRTSTDNEQMFLKSQMNYLEGELEIHRPIQRISKNVKSDAIRHYCYLNNITLAHYSPELFRENQMQNSSFVDEKNFQKGLRNICKGFIHMENTYRNLYRGVIMERIEKIEGWIDEIENL
jgi:hypothetical protein